MRDLLSRLAAIEFVVESDSAFVDGPGLWVDGTEIAHLHGDHLEVRLTRTVIRNRPDLMEPGGVSRRAPSSDWVVLEHDGSPADDDHAVALVRAAADAHRPPPGVTPRPPPQGADLERRRRFH